MAFQGIRHAKQLIFWGLAGGLIGALVDWYYQIFPLFFGAGLLGFELFYYFYLRIKYRKNPRDI